MRYTEQKTNHYIAFTLLAIVRDKGDLISLITSDVEMLEVFYAHTISPICIAIVTEIVMCLFIGSFHPYMGLLTAAAFFCVGVAVPLIISKVSGNTGDEIKRSVGRAGGSGA